MIRSTLTAHLADKDRDEMTLQINDRDIGVLATQEQRHYVMSGNRRVQLIAGLHTDPEDAASVLSTRALLRHWLVTFRELQINGLSRFPVMVERNRLEADFLLLFDSERIVIWCDPGYAVYLSRGRHIYRQQPTYHPEHGSLSVFGRGLDFYSFRPREGDDLLIVDPAFIDLFDPRDLEDLFADIHQINVAMMELTRLSISYGRNIDPTWFSVQIQKVEPDLEMFSAESRERVAGRRGPGEMETPWLQRLSNSKVVPLLDGNLRITPAGYKRFQEGNRNVQDVPVYRQKPPQFKTIWTEGQQAPASLPTRETDHDRRSLHSQDSIAERYRKNPSLLDRQKHWHPTGFASRISKMHHKMTHLIPASRGMSWLAYIATWLVMLLVLVSVFVGVRSIMRGNKPTETQPLVTTPSVEDETPKTDFEIDITVKASSLRVVSSPGGDELVGTVTRGDRVTQLANPKDGWILIKMTDGRLGYVPESLLLFPDEGE